MEDLKEDLHQDDLYFLHIGDHVAGYEIPQEDIDRNVATKGAFTCLQTRLATAHTKLVAMESLEKALDLRHKHYNNTDKRAVVLATEISTLKAREGADKKVFERMMSEKLVELESKDKEIEVLRVMCQTVPATEELAELQKDLLESRSSKLEYLGLAEDYFNLLERADKRQEQAKHEAEAAKIAETFAKLEQQSAKECREDLSERQNLGACS